MIRRHVLSVDSVGILSAPSSLLNMMEIRRQYLEILQDAETRKEGIRRWAKEQAFYFAEQVERISRHDAPEDEKKEAIKHLNDEKRRDEDEAQKQLQLIKQETRDRCETDLNHQIQHCIDQEIQLIGQIASVQKSIDDFPTVVRVLVVITNGHILVLEEKKRALEQQLANSQATRQTLEEEKSLVKSFGTGTELFPQGVPEAVAA